ncbi:hypothetical protein [Nocardia aurea]|uniref:hypothetical protein n=1 Tax=Nocardia aurea TaxID=2144174 RepID=UPI0033ABFAFA
MTTPGELPTRYMVIGHDGLPNGVVDLEELQTAAWKLAYALVAAVATGGDDAVDEHVKIWTDTVPEGSEGFIASCALSFTIRSIVAPLIDIIDGLGPELHIREKLADADTFAKETLGGRQ